MNAEPDPGPCPACGADLFWEGNGNYHNACPKCEYMGDVTTTPVLQRQAEKARAYDALDEDPPEIPPTKSFKVKMKIVSVEKEPVAKLEEDVDLPYDYICHQCADVRGGVWPEGHVATFHTGNCPYCDTSKGLANIGDWDWSDGAKRGMRD